MKSLFGAFAGYLRPYRRYVVLLVLALLVDLAFNAIMPLGFKYLIDDAIPNQDRDLLWTVLTVMIVAVVVAGLVAVGRDYLYAKLGTKVMNDLRLRMFEHLQRLSADYYGREHVGDIMARFSTDLASVNNAVVSALPETILGVLGIVFYSILLALLELRLALIVLVASPFLVLGPRWLGPKAEEESMQVREAEAGIATAVEENVSAQAVIRAFGLAGTQVAGFRGRLDEMYRRSLRFNLLSYLVERTPNVAFLALQVGVLATGAVMAVGGDLGIGTLVAFSSLLTSLSASILGLTRIMPPLLEAYGGVQRIDRLLAERPAVLDPPEDEPLAPLSDRIAFDEVVFSYDGDRRQLDGVSFSIRQGTSVAFVGASGSGKSTVLNLIMRFFDPHSGVVSIDGRDLRTVPQASLRDQIGVVLQENLLFDTTIRENIRMGRLTASDEEVEAAARAAEVEDVIHAVAGGYDATLGERGGHLSGGQRQRIAVARAIVRDPRILVLDEATSALDPGTESAVNATLERLAAGRTVVAVSHRLATIAGYDRIFVLHEGRLVEEGTHDELVERGGRYSELWAKQSGVQVTHDGRSASVSSDYFRTVPVLANLSDDVLERLSQLVTTEHVPEGHVVAREGESTDGKFYIVARGKVAVSTEDEGADDVLHHGHCFGEQSLVDEVPHPATVRTVTPTVLLTLRREDVHREIGSPLERKGTDAEPARQN